MDFNVHLIEMAGGNSCLESSYNLGNENDEFNDEGTKSGFDDARDNPDSNCPKLITCMYVCM